MLAHPPTKPAHALPRVQVRSRAHGQLWSRPEGCKTASRKKTSFSRLRAHARCPLAQTVPKANALFLRASVSSKTVGEYDNGSASGAGRVEYIWLPTDDGSAIPIAMLRGSRYYQIHSDHLGTPRLIKDDAAKPTWQWAYSAFGDNKPTGILKATANPNAAITNQPNLLQATGAMEFNLRFPGQYMDSETGQFYNYFRNYMPSQARYGQNDPIGLNGGMNRFIYAGGDGLNGFDPYGLDVCLLTTRNSIGVGTHSAIYISGPKPVIYDPSGNYAYSKTGEEFAYGPLADIQKFRDFHKKKDGDSTDVSCRKTTSEEDKKIYEKALEQDQGFGPVCSRRISDLLSGSPSFPGVSPGTWFPGNLARQFK